MLENISTIAPIVSAVAMIILAILTYFSVRIMRKESTWKNRPVIHVRELEDILKTKDDKLLLRYHVVNSGTLPGIMKAEKVTLNHKPFVDINNPDEFTIFPQQNLWILHIFDKAAVVRQDNQFELHIEIDYHNLGDKKLAYHYEIDYQIVTEKAGEDDFHVRGGSSIINCISD